MAHSSEIAALDAKRLQLARDLDLLDKQRAHALARIAPIRRIVDDILAYIFELGAADEVLFPEKVSAVSRHWRNVVLQTPNAWSNLIWDRRAFVSFGAFTRRAAVLLERSQAASLTILLDLLPSPLDADVHQLSDLLHPHLARCAVFHLHIDTNWLSVMSLSTLGPNLREIDIRTSHNNLAATSLSLSEVDGCVPWLQTLILSNLPPSSLAPTRYPSLRNLQLHGTQWQFGNDGSHEWPWQTTASLLDSSPNLQSLTLNRMEFILDGAELLTPRKIVLKSLKSLTFECMETRSIAIVLESLEAPFLKSLKMRYDPTKMGDHWCIHRLEAPCIVGIEELEVEGYAIYGSNLPWFLRTLSMVPRLTKLTIANPPLFLDSRFFDIMSTGPNWLVPRLNDLHLTACANLHGQDLIRLLRARSVHLTSGGVSPIRSVTLKTPPWNMLEEDVLSVIRLNVEELHLLPLDPYLSDRFMAPTSPMFRVATPTPLPPIDHAWDVPPLLGTPFHTDENVNGVFMPPLQPQPNAVSTGTSSTRRSSLSRARSRRSVGPEAVKSITNMLLIASATALMTSVTCYHLFSRHVRT
ncbi:hypothetical protein M408DRAFT_325347 [Serendipita vermifera MAFF 305830]|uniref:F-box domain-containing protein n=1 Tax=Serendipita vermifera MAFF 305830 TaxID=933852 RepID=A0A0C3BNS0_SERVB|nr:hypothetical protein M408DRAFT_325347 [Serendipita vermifera MAFF 305830]